MANYKTIKQLRDTSSTFGDHIREMVEAGLRLGAAAEHLAIKAHIMRSDYSNATGNMAAGRILDFINTRKQKKATKTR